MLLILLVGTGLRWHHLAHKSLWVDEIGQVVLAQGGLVETILAPRIHVAAPPLDYVLTWFALELGAHEFILRFAPAAWSILTLAVLYTFARRVTRSQMVAVVAALLLALSAAAVQYAQQVRFYALGTLLLTLCVYLFVRAVEMSTRKNWFVFGIALGLAFYAHYYAIVLAGLLTLFMLVAALARFLGARFRTVRFLAPLCGTCHIERSEISRSARYDRSLPKQSSRTDQLGVTSIDKTRAQWFGFVGAMGLFVLLSLPWLLYAGRGAETVRGFALPNSADILLKPLFGAALGTNPATLMLGSIYVGAAAFGAWTLWRAQASTSLLLMILVIGGACAVIVADLFSNHPFAPRQLIFFAPYYFVLIAVGLDALWQRLAKRMVVRFAAVILVIGFVLGISFQSLNAYYNAPQDDWRSAARVIARAIQPNDALVFTLPTLPTYLNYYAPDLEAYMRAPSNETDARRVWIIGWGAQSKRRAQALVPQHWHAIALNAENDLQALYAGNVSEDALWREASEFELTPQVLAYSEVLERSARMESALRARVGAQARAALTDPTALLLDSQRAMLQEKLSKYGY